MAHQSHRSHAPRGLQRVLGASPPPGKYGRMFPWLPPLFVDEKDLETLGSSMKAPAAEGGGFPAGYTFLGQFVDHDVTFDPTSLREAAVDPLALTNYRTPALTLDNLYGRGPDIDILFYAWQNTDPGSEVMSASFQLGQTNASGFSGAVSLPFDLQRTDRTRIAVIADSRNDENLIVAQFHVAMQRFHNAVVKSLDEGKPGQSAGQLFASARDAVLAYYHGIVLQELLPMILDEDVLQGVRSNGSLLYRDTNEPYIPVEFAAAAYRFGHATIRDDYDYNSFFSQTGQNGRATLQQLFDQAGASHHGGRDASLLRTEWVIDWRRFFPGLGFDKLLDGNESNPIGPHLASKLAALPGFTDEANLAIRNLKRGNSLRLPSGQSVAKYFGYTPLSRSEIGPDACKLGLGDDTPLWYYILKEAEVRQKGSRLGQVGSRIVAEVLIGLLGKEDPWVLDQSTPFPGPTLGGKLPGEFKMADLLTFAGFISPLDNIPVGSGPKPVPVPATDPAQGKPAVAVVPPPQVNPAPAVPPQ